MIATYIIGKGNEKRRKKEIEDSQSNASRRKIAWVKETTDRTLEHALSEAFDKKDPIIVKKLEDALGEINIGLTAEWLYPSSLPPTIDNAGDKKEIALMILMGAEGKLTHKCATEGVYARPGFLCREYAMNIFLWIDDRLKEHGHNANIYSTSWTQSNVIPLKRDADYRMLFNYFTWEPLLKWLAYDKIHGNL